MEKVLIRPMEIADVPSIVKIENESFPNPWPEQSFIKELSIKFSRFFVAETGGKIAGYAGIWFFAGEGHIINIATEKKLRNKGIGKIFIRHLIGFAKEHGLSALFLEVASKNSAARRLYKSFGFEEYTVRRDYYPGDDAILMSCKL